MAKPESRNSIQVIERMTRLLEVLARHTQPVALKVLAQASDLHPSTAHRILEEAELGVRCIGAGVRNDAGALVAGLSVSAPAERMKTAWSGLVRETAAKISRAIGHRE